MAWRVQRRKQLGGNTRLFFNKGGIGISTGVGPFRRSYSTSGNRGTSLRIPGTGAYWYKRDRIKPSSSKKARQGGTPEQTPAQPALRAPGRLAARADRALYDALHRRDVDALEAVAQRYGDSHGTLAAALTANLLATDNPARAHTLLTHVITNRADPQQHPYTARYGLPPLALPTDANLRLLRRCDLIGLILLLTMVTDEVDGDTLTVTRTLAGADRQALVMHGLHLRRRGQAAELLQVTEGVTNDDDLGAYLCVLRAWALAEQERYADGRAALREALRSTQRTESVQLYALLTRGQLNLADNKIAQARKDLGRVAESSPRFPGLAEAQAALPPTAPPEQAGAHTA